MKITIEVDDIDEIYRAPSLIEFELHDRPDRSGRQSPRNGRTLTFADGIAFRIWGGPDHWRARQLPKKGGNP